MLQASGFRLSAWGLRVKGLWVKEGLGIRVQGLKFRIEGLGFRV